MRIEPQYKGGDCVKNRDKLPYNSVTGKSFYNGEEFPVWYNPVIPGDVKIYENFECTKEAKLPYENFRSYYIKGDLKHYIGLQIDGVKYPNPSTPIEWIPSRYGVIQLYNKTLWDFSMPGNVKIYDDVNCTIIAQKPYLVGKTYYIKCENLTYNEYLEIDGVKIEDCTNATEFIPNIDSCVRIRKRLEWNNNPLPNGVGVFDDKAGHIVATKPYLVGKPYYIRCSNLGNRGIEIDGVKIEECSTGIEFIPSIHSEIRLYDFKTWNGIFNDTSGVIVKVYKYGDLVTEINPPYLVGEKYVLEVNNTLSKGITIMIDNTFYTVPSNTTKYYDFIPHDDLVISIDCNLPVSTGGGGSDYDIVIKTQAEFDQLISSSNWLGVNSVLFDGKNGIFTSDGDITIPFNVYIISGINNATFRCSFRYSSLPSYYKHLYSISNIYIFNLHRYNGIKNCINVSNVTVVASEDCIVNCENVSNVYVYGKDYCLSGCKNVVNVSIFSKGKNNAFTMLSCYNVTNCYIETDGYAVYDCENVSNVRVSANAKYLFGGTNKYIDNETVVKLT